MKSRATWFLSFILSCFAGISFSQAQEKEAAEVRKWVESKNYVFNAEFVFATGARTYLTPGFNLMVSPDTIISALPYFGRAHTAPIDPTKGGIQFTSTDFSYKTETKGDKWEVEIRPKNEDQTEIMFLTIFNNGQASLRVESKFRQSISFSGAIESRK